MIGPLAAAGFRVVAPDFIGFGRSDKPASISDYSYASHLAWLRTFLDAVSLTNVTVFCQDWGALLALRLAGEEPERFARIMVSNGFLPTGRGRMPPSFLVWRAFARYSPWFPIARIVRAATLRSLGAAELSAYDAPFPGAAYEAGARAFPRLVPTSEDDPAAAANQRAWDALGRFDKPFLCVFGRDDPILGRADRPLIEHVPGAAGQPHARIRGGHFVQEDAGPELAQRLVTWARGA